MTSGSMPCRFHILKDEACNRLARGEIAGEREQGREESVKGAISRLGASASSHVGVAVPEFASDFVGQISFTAGMLAFHISRQSLSRNRSQHFQRYS